MTLDDLVKTANDAVRRSGRSAEFADRIMVRAVVEALRGEFDWDSNIYEQFTEILGSDAVVKAAGGPTSNEGHGVALSPASTPAADVCEWTPRKNVGWFQPSCRQSRMHETSAALKICPSCKKPISVKETPCPTRGK